MNKPNGYDQVSAGDFEQIKLGGHHLVIKGVRETQSKSGRDMIVVAFDFSPKDSQPDYFAKDFAADIRPDKKWPNAGTQYILVYDQNNNASRNFKRFITAVEKSNKGFSTQWGDTFCAQFKGKLLGGIFGEVEEEYNGSVYRRHRLRWFCEDYSVDSAAIPEPRLLQDNNVTQKAPRSDGFVPVDAAADTPNIPF